MPSLLDYSKTELAEILSAYGQPNFRAKQLFSWLHKGVGFSGMTNIGYRPTLGLGNERTIETNIFDFDEDIYGLDIQLRFVSRVRDEMKFDSMKELAAQLEKDRAVCCCQ